MKEELEIKDKTESNESIKIAPFKKHIRKTEPHKHNNYIEIIYLSKGEGTHTIDHNSYVIHPPVIFFVRKEQVHYWELDTEPDGFVVIIKKTFMEKSLDDELKLLFEKISSENSLRVDDNKTINTLLELLTKENKAMGENTFHIIEGLLKSLLAKILQVAKPVIRIQESRPGLFHSYLNLLHESNVVSNKVSYYAAKLNVSPQNLNIACRKTANQSASAMLAEFIISEAKRLLLYTDKTIAEISYALEFNDPSHFVKYFKRNTGQTPKSFRKDN